MKHNSLDLVNEMTHRELRMTTACPNELNYMYEMATLPGDPREDDVCGLDKNGMLCMNLLDFILHSTCMHYTDADEINYCLGGTITRQLFPRLLMPITDPNAEQEFKKKCTQFNGVERGKHRLVIPDIDEAHCNVIDVMIDNNSKNFITKVLFYVSMASPTASGKKKRIIPACIKEFIAKPSWSIQQILSQTKEDVGSHQVPFPMCTLETLQKYCSTSSLLLTFC